jgi:hypothetical protein
MAGHTRLVPCILENRQASSIGVCTLDFNWILTGVAVLLLIALIPGVSRKLLLDFALGGLSVGVVPLAGYWMLALPLRNPWKTHQRKAARHLAGSADEWNTAITACGADISPYWGLLTEFIVLPFGWLGLPIGYVMNTWAILFVAIMAMGLSLHLAALRFWLFSPDAEKTPYICCNLPLREFHVALTGEFGFRDYLRKMLNSCKI